MGKDRPSVSDAEMQVLKVLWDTGPATVRDINATLRRKKRRWAYNTVLTLLSRLRDKGFVASEQSGVAHVFRATVTREVLLRRRLSALADQICDGTASPLVHALVSGARFTSQEIDEFRQLLDQLENQPPKAAKKRRTR